jgi:Family of unknown function (DUF6169)
MERTNDKPLAYPFVFEIGRNYSYAFETSNQVFYEAKFKHFDYFFKSEIYRHQAYEFTIEILLNPYEQLPPQDPRIQPTIAAIILNFFDTIALPIVLYVCDSSDGKQLVRSRLFSVWFTEYQTPDMAKIDSTLRDKNGDDVPISLILKTTNPYRRDIIDEFFRTIGGYHK